MKIVKWLDYKEVGPGKRPEQSIKEGMTRSFSICSLTAKFDIQSFDESRW